MIRDRKYLDWLREQPCVISGTRGHSQETVDPAHIGAFKGMKRSDNEALPLLHRFHLAGHRGGEMSMWRREMPDSLLRECLRAFARQMYEDYKHDRP